ncbi:hypothetical protein F5Y18DRAFT_119477 [Xylariaceae sp. FL1019]|nr:hypothetical protein F5Y18DRAFT_119477 [Xylariaceae sp. FL1019]
MANFRDNTYVARSRGDRSTELAIQSGDRNADALVLLGLSVRLRSRNIHVDYTGGLNTVKILDNILGWGIMVFIKAYQLVWPSPSPVIGSGFERRPGTRNNRKVETAELSSSRDALAEAAPIYAQGLRLGSKDVADKSKRAAAEKLSAERAFKGVVTSIDTVALAELARRLLYTRQQNREEGSLQGQVSIPLPKISEPFYGSGHSFYMIQFCDDGSRQPLKWIMKIPNTGLERVGWDRPTLGRLKTEALLLQMLRTEAGVPVPDVIGANFEADDECNVPYLIMEFVEGKRLTDVWFGDDQEESADFSTLRRRRQKILENVAEAMLRLGKFQFDEGGSPVFDDESQQCHVGPATELDTQTMVDRWYQTEGQDTRLLWKELGPWRDTVEMHTALLDAHPPITEIERAVHAGLRLFLGEICEPAESDPPPGSGHEGQRKKFVLCHPDLSLRNIIMADDTMTIKAIVGWDGARIAPHSIGNMSFPRWLVRDLNPFAWRWEPTPAADSWQRNQVSLDCNRFEDAPWVLRELREFYVQAIQGTSETDDMGQRCLQRERSSAMELERRNQQCRDHRITRHSRADITTQSLLALSLDAAIRDPRCRIPILRHLLQKCSRASETFTFDEIVQTFGQGRTLGSVKQRCLLTNIRELATRGFVHGSVVW